MALSEQERKLLEQLEASLAAEDPTFADTLRDPKLAAGTPSRHVIVHKRYATLAGVGFLMGIIVLIAGVRVHPIVSVLGFILMLLGAIIGLRAWKHVDGDNPPHGGDRLPRGGHNPPNQHNSSQQPHRSSHDTSSPRSYPPSDTHRRTSNPPSDPDSLAHGQWEWVREQFHKDLTDDLNKRFRRLFRPDDR